MVSQPASALSETILERLTRLHPKVIDLSLGRIERLLAALGHPERHLPPVIHVAGTNGKGSVVAFLRAMLEASGRRVHVYTSPHLVRFHERVRLAGTVIAEAELAAILAECERANDGAPITFFEITTAAALLAFARHPADVVLLEVGLGGRLDATNVVERPAATVITALDLDHQIYLGESLAAIAAEKAGILKPGVPAVVARQPEDAEAVIMARAEAIGAVLRVHGEDWTAHEERGRLVFQDERGLLDLPLPRLIGRHQIENAGLAIAALRALGPPLGERAIEAGLRDVCWPARLQRLRRGPLVAALPQAAELWLDGGHNPGAARALAQSLAEFEERASRPLHLVAGMLASKDAAGFFAPFRGLAKRVWTVPIAGESNALDPAALSKAAAAAGLTAEAVPDPHAACTVIAAEEAAPRVLICGSLYLAGQVLRENE